MNSTENDQYQKNLELLAVEGMFNNMHGTALGWVSHGLEKSGPLSAERIKEIEQVLECPPLENP